ncbi:hypothetical protein MUK42_05998 [Musa troglodytarum]|uniref:glucose-1-phosphate adenylyltransferase n=1 Tax=Musa troglodytarum TaxID=320322 RepID=A0A9E7L1E8_9LILI|nr:hypothetical protein MUK42_05998 [Musa troglodytarum]
MDVCCVGSMANACFSQVKRGSVGCGESGIWGDGIGNGPKTTKVWDSKVAKSLKSRSSFGGRKTGVAFSVLTSDVNQETMVFHAPMFGKRTADPKSVASIILGGGAGTQLVPLTSTRATPAVPIGGCYRLIDIPMSNCINSGINKIFIMTQFNSASLNRHISRTYNFGNGINFGDGFVEVLAATQTPGEAGMNWFQGTADAVRQFTWVFEDNKNKNIEHILILSGDQLYRMDYMDLKHVDTGADMTVSCVPVGHRWNYPKSNDFGSEILPSAVEEHNVQAYVFSDYWEDIGTIRSFFDANLALTEQVVDAIISHGCFLRECSVERSIVGVRSRLDFGAELKDTMMMGADIYETEAEIASHLANDRVPIGVGQNTKIRSCVIDMNARIGKNVVIANKDGVQEADRASEGFYIRSGIVVILKNATIKDGTVI